MLISKLNFVLALVTILLVADFELVKFGLLDPPMLTTAPDSSHPQMPDEVNRGGNSIKPMVFPMDQSSGRRRADHS